MHPDALGFLYPKVDKSKCTECGLCTKVCKFKNGDTIENHFGKPLAYAARHKDINEIKKSRSGAVFITLAHFVLDKGGVVYGAGYSDHFRIVHKRATNFSECEEFRGSKYVQSDLTGVFKSIRNDLLSEKTVLFSGTPCQTNGLYHFLGKKLRENIILVDIICHGVPSPNVWQDNLANLEKKYKSRITRVNFRNKLKYGWDKHVETYTFENGKSIDCNEYSRLFIQDIVLRKSCGICPFANTNRPSDITIGDFWGWESIDADFNKDNMGCNLLYINTDKGVRVFNEVKDILDIIPTKLENTLQPNLKSPSPIDQNRDRFEFIYRFWGYNVAKFLYIKKGPFDKIKKKLSKVFLR